MYILLKNSKRECCIFNITVIKLVWCMESFYCECAASPTHRHAMHFRIERLLSFRRGLSTASSRAVHGLNLSRPSLLRSQSYIDGHWIDSAQKKVFSVVNPATELILANVADCGPSETQIAILAAHRYAFFHRPYLQLLIIMYRYV